MLTRTKLVSVVAVVLSLYIVKRVYADRVESIDRATKDVGSDNGLGGLLSVITNIQGWALKMDESVIWRLYIFNHDPVHHIKVVRAKPFTDGPWVTEQITDVAPNTYYDQDMGKMDNDDQFFYVVVQDDSGKWNVANGDQGHSTEKLTNGNSAANMFWTEGTNIVQVIVWAH